MKKYLIALDAGHGINTSGKRTPKLNCDLVMDGKTYKKGSTIREREFNQRIMKLVEKELDKIPELSYVECVESITEDTSLANRVKKANDNNADLFVSIHANALTGKWQTGAYGLVSIHTQNCSSKSITLAKNCYDYLSKEVQWYSNGATKYGIRTDVDLTGNTYYVLRNTKMPAVLLELGFMDNINDVKVMITDKFAKDCASSIVKGICKTLGIDYKVNNQSTTSNGSQANLEGEKMYKVCIGAFKSRDNAVKMKNEAISKGFKDAYMIYE